MKVAYRVTLRWVAVLRAVAAVPALIVLTPLVVAAEGQEASPPESDRIEPAIYRGGASEPNDRFSGFQERRTRNACYCGFRLWKPFETVSGFDLALRSPR
ncbi:MAG: hypothetical protein DMG06_19480 [Acidobacteria bacterium]|nr:MAG: hypothetical protein DMG06_19480 [Acidobacteriota bacterium]